MQAKRYLQLLTPVKVISSGCENAERTSVANFSKTRGFFKRSQVRPSHRIHPRQCFRSGWDFGVDAN